MNFSRQIKPISFVKSHAAEVLSQLEAEREPLIITQNGEAKAVLVDLTTYEETQETLALLKLLALGRREVSQGEMRPVHDVVARLRAKLSGNG